jgi:predicted outer membrane protein
MRSLALAMTAPFFLACAHTAPSVFSSAGGSVDLAAYPIPPLNASETTLLRGMSDADILGHFITVDSMQVATADTLVRLSKTDDVVTYAKLVRASHAQHLRVDSTLARQAGVIPTMLFGGLRASHVAAELDSTRLASDLTVDRHYIMSQIELNEHVLAELQVLEGVAQNPALREEIRSMMPVLRDHLARAHAIAIEKGFEKKRSA